MARHWRDMAVAVRANYTHNHKTTMTDPATVAFVGLLCAAIILTVLGAMGDNR